MTSQLASQLQRLQQRPAESSNRLAKSFLFSTQDAQSFSREQIHQLALNGLQTLTAMDNRFHPFIQDLFDVKKIRQERAMLTSSEDAALRASLEHVLTLLSPHLFLTAAQQVFEFLVRVYEVHIYDVSAVLRAFLPYHDHNLFARVLLLLDLRDTGFDFLSTNQLRGAPLLREHLVLACAESRKAARLVCLTVTMPFRYEIRHHAANALFTSIVTQLATHKDGEALWRTFLPSVLELLSGAVTGAEAGTEETKRAQQLRGGNALQRGGRVSQDSVATALVVLAAWSGQVRFSSSMLITVLKPIFRYLTSAAFAVTSSSSSGNGGAEVFLPVRDLLAFLEIVFATQHRALMEVSVQPLLQSLLALPWRPLASQLPFAESTEVVVVGPTGVPSTSPRHSVLLATLLQTALDRLTCASEVRLLPADVVEFLSSAAEDLPLSNVMVASYLRVLMTAEAGAAAEKSEGDTPTLYHRAIAALERRYAVVFDEVLSEVLLHADTAAAASAFIARHFQGTRYNLVEVGSTLPGTTESLPLFACLLHPVAEVRALAAKTLQGMTVAQWMGDGSSSSTMDVSSSAAAQGEIQPLVGLLAHVVSYEHVTNVAEVFVATGTTMVQQLTARFAQDETISAACRAACKLVRAFYLMVLSLLEGHADHPAARAEALQRVVLPLLKFLLRPAVTTWTAAPSPSAATRHFRACVLYHVTLLLMQRTATGGLSALAEVFGEGAGLLEVGFGDASGLAPLLRAASERGNPGKTKEKDDQVKTGGRPAASDSDDDEKGKGKAAASCTSSVLFKGLMQCKDLLKEIRTEAREHLAKAFAAARTAVRESSESDGANTVEVVVALAATLLPVKETKSALQATSAIATFLCGADGAPSEAARKEQVQQQEGYLSMVYAALLEKTGSRRAAQTGRGAVDATAVARQELHRHPLVQKITLVLRTALRQALNSPDATTASSAALTVRLCKLLAYTGASLPPVTLQPETLATAYLDLINDAPVAAVSVSAAEEEEVDKNTISGSLARRVDWYALVARAVFEAVDDDEDEGNSTKVELPNQKAMPSSSLTALALALFLPLRAPTTQRLKQLRTLQDAVVSAGGKRNAASCAYAIVASAMRNQQQLNGTSVTALSCIIECMTLGERQYQLTSGATELLCGLLTLRRASAGPTDDDAATYVVPAGWAHRVIRYFFAAGSNSAERGRGSLIKASSSSSTATASPQQMCLTQKLLSRVEGILTSAGTASQTSSKARATRSSVHTVAADTADLVDAVCSRLQLWGEEAATEAKVQTNASVRLMEVLLRHPHLHVRNGGGARPVYRHALTALTVGLSAGLEDRRHGHSTIFTSKAKKTSDSNIRNSSAITGDYQKLVARQLRSTVLHAMDVIGTDVAVACMSTLGGYEYFFLPLVRAAEDSMNKTAEEDVSTAAKRSAVRQGKKVPQQQDEEEPAAERSGKTEAGLVLQRVREMLEMLAPVDAGPVHAEATEAADNASAEDDSSNGRWRPPAATVVSNPLTYADAVRVLRLPRICAGVATDKWGLGSVSQECLELLRMLLQVLPTIIMDDDEDQESAYHLVEQCLELYPLQEMEGLLRQAAVVAAVDDVALMPRVQQVRLGARGSVQVEAVLRYVESLVRVCTEMTRLLSEKVADGAYHIKSRLLREMMVLMARMLVDAEEGERDEEASRTGAKKADETAQDATDTAERRREELHFHVDTIASLLRSTAPLLKLPSGFSARTATATAVKDDQDSVTYLHIPLVSLLIKLEQIDNTEALGFRSAREVCQEILTSFDIRTQVQCVTQLMRLVADPAAQLASAASEDADGEDEHESEMKRLQHLFRRMVKPNQVINRQETILHLVNLTVKSDLFLEPFLTLQRHARSSPPRRGSKMHKKSNKAAAEAGLSGGEDTDDEEGDKAEDVAQREDGGCMELLVSALELFAHYHDLHDDTHAAESAPAGVAEAEAEAYTALLELLAGNTLACVLAGINESTFVVCQLRLLEDKRAALRKIGLEVLLDRLHHSLPTLENVVSDEEMEAHRRRLRDPRVRLSLTDLVRIKARPLTTKRSTILFPLLVKAIKTNFASFYAFLQDPSTTTTSVQFMAADQLLVTAQLGIACVEELTRIVSSGGSLQSERTLLNASRSRRLTEAALVKLFGNRGRVTEVREFVETVCNHWMPLLTRCEMRLRGRGAPCDADSDSSPLLVFYAAAEGILGCMTCLMTTLATITQVMGTAFATAHSLSLLHTLVSAGMYQVVEMPGLLARSQAGALLRHSTLSSLIRCFPACWQMTQPYLPSLLFIASHLTNVTDAESHYLCAEMLAVLEAVMEPQLLLDAGTSCLRGIPYVNGAVVPASEQHQLVNLTQDAAGASTAIADGASKKPSARRSRQVRVQVHTHSFSLLFTCIERRIENLSKEELMHMPTLMEGTRPQQNFWLAALNSLASAQTVPSSEAIMPVLEAFTVFLLKFKAKHSARLLRVVADWAFAETSSGVAGTTSAHANSDADEHDGRGHDGEAQSLSRLTLQSWIVFFALSNHLLGKLGSILDFAFPTFTPHIVTTLRTYCDATATVATATNSLVALVLEGALECLRGMALAQTPGPDHDYSIPLDVYFANADVFPGVMPALVHQLHNLQFLEDSLHDYRFRVEHNVVPAIRAFMACLGSSKLQSKTQAEVVRALRHPSRHVRREALVCLDGIYADGGEELASRLMAEMLPTVVELTEDRDDAVVEEARKLCNNLSHMTGQDVLYAMS
ncbi:hypothetical protein ABB37_09462 [Leptomonas pyrrhocoris]|uniref:HEAT repeat-containing protein 1 n=1 Tax=Leptomonas pyrrhocoris TaxID=157538 RepID=A0A0M9FR27_LEPPY|nr:hypothetical protein ABB37_09462 [Leptomonas pyrrhocoris]KPA74209.1 hypothetical protein ABB37_09462 [Leptomonas pyrrhocoris]|eukprot:XP_015652648.1 hypothetical protein ABB37_09462 [Leptomonas pyrrhocoris]